MSEKTEVKKTVKFMSKAREFCLVLKSTRSVMVDGEKVTMHGERVQFKANVYDPYQNDGVMGNKPEAKIAAIRHSIANVEATALFVYEVPYDASELKTKPLVVEADITATIEKLQAKIDELEGKQDETEEEPEEIGTEPNEPEYRGIPTDARFFVSASKRVKYNVLVAVPDGKKFEVKGRKYVDGEDVAGESMGLKTLKYLQKNREEVESLNAAIEYVE